MNAIKSKIKALLPIVFFLVVSIAIVSAETALPVYRFYNENTGDHFYTISNAERNKVIEKYPTIYADEGIAFYAYQNQTEGTLPVYRFWSATGDHFYTINETEKTKILNDYSNTYVFEQIAFYTFANQTGNTLPVYRFWNHVTWNKATGNHFYTISESEKEKLTTNPSFAKSWTSEGISFYAYKNNQSATNQTEQNQTEQNQTQIELYVSSLKVEDKTENSITWEWTNPETNFSGIAVYIDDENVANLSNSENSYKAEDLESNEVYTITLKMIVNGSVSSDGVSSSVRTNSEDSDNSNSVVVSSHRASATSSETPIVFTSYRPEATPITLSSTNQKTESNAQSFKLATIHYILTALIILSLIVLIFIFKNL